MASDNSPQGQLRELVTHSPRIYGKPRSTWTLKLLAEVCFEKKIVNREVSPSTICRTLARIGIKFKRASLWITSPDPEYLIKKAKRDQWIAESAKHSDWVLGFVDEVWWSRLYRPRMSAWTGGSPLKLHVLTAEENDPDPVAICCYGIYRNDNKKVLLRFAEDRPTGDHTIQFLQWVTEVLAKEEKKRLIVIWDNAAWHVGQMVFDWISKQNDRTTKDGGVAIDHCELPIASPWLNNIEPCFQHAKKAIVEPARLLTAKEIMDRSCKHFGCEVLGYLGAVVDAAEQESAERAGKREGRP